MKWILLFLFPALATSCNYTINLVHTEGSASDIIDDTDALNPNIDIPIAPVL